MGLFSGYLEKRKNKNTARFVLESVRLNKVYYNRKDIIVVETESNRFMMEYHEVTFDTALQLIEAYIEHQIKSMNRSRTYGSPDDVHEFSREVKKIAKQLMSEYGFHSQDSLMRSLSRKVINLDAVVPVSVGNSVNGVKY